MKLIIKPDSDDLGLVLAAAQYKKMWDEHGDEILQTFHTVTGMSINRTQITARVVRAVVSSAGNGASRRAMRLAAGDYRSDEFKLMTIIHELTHRLLITNGYASYSMGYQGPYEQEIDHRHSYLIEYDVVLQALGEKWAKVCREYEERYEWGESESPHVAAWNWAMNMTPQERAENRQRLFETHRPHDKGARVTNY